MTDWPRAPVLCYDPCGRNPRDAQPRGRGAPPLPPCAAPACRARARAEPRRAAPRRGRRASFPRAGPDDASAPTPGWRAAASPPSPLCPQVLTPAPAPRAGPRHLRAGSTLSSPRFSSARIAAGAMKTFPRRQHQRTRRRSSASALRAHAPARAVRRTSASSLSTAPLSRPLSSPNSSSTPTTPVQCSSSLSCCSCSCARSVGWRSAGATSW